jgi:outer membrane protein assembly factor BamB
MRRNNHSFLAVVLIATGTLLAEDWPMFRGSNRDGISHESTAPLHWGPQKNVKWRAALPQPGNSSPIVSKDRVFVTCAEDEKGHHRSLYCFDRADGKELWVKTVEYDKMDPTHPRNPYCGSSPAADGERVVVWHGSAGVHCYDFAGSEPWSRDLGEFRHVWGYASSPVIHGDTIFLNCGPGARSFVIALDKKTGKTLWQTDEPGGAEDKNDKGKWVGSWNTPVIAKVEGHEQLLVCQSHHVNAYDLESGKILWTTSGTGDLAYADVMAGDGVAVAASGYGGPAIGFKLGGSGDVTDAKRLWRTDRNPQRVGTGVVLGKYLYMVNEPLLSCIELSSGKEMWKYRKPGLSYWGSVVAVGDKLYVNSQQGTTVAFAADPKAFHLLAENAMDEGCNSTLAVSDGQLFLRTFKAVYCIEEK